jgi:UDP-glucuronate 4-epimerase
MATLITGGAGFIGSRLAKRLLAQNEEIVILDNLDSYYDPAIKQANIAELGEKANFIQGDIRDREQVEAIFDRYPITRVAHMAAMSNVRYSAERGLLYAEVNTNGSVLLLDTARKHDVSVFVMGSTSSVYGHTARVPFVEEDSADHPLAPYPASKRAAELFGYSYHQLFGLNVTILRFFNVYGPHGRPDMMPMRAIDAILNDKTIEKFDGGALQRDWTYIDDILDGIIAALERPLGYQIMNLGCGAPITLNDFIRIFEYLIEKEAITVDVPIPLTEPRITYCDNTRAGTLLGFHPKVGIEEGLARTWAWYRSRYLDGY